MYVKFMHLRQTAGHPAYDRAMILNEFEPPGLDDELTHRKNVKRRAKSDNSRDYLAEQHCCCTILQLDTCTTST